MISPAPARALALVALVLPALALLFCGSAAAQCLGPFGTFTIPPGGTFQIDVDGDFVNDYQIVRYRYGNGTQEQVYFERIPRRNGDLPGMAPGVQYGGIALDPSPIIAIQFVNLMELTRPGGNYNNLLRIRSYLGVQTGPNEPVGFIVFEAATAPTPSTNLTLNISQRGFVQAGAASPNGNDCSSLGGPLPVELTSFAAAASGGGVELAWSTADEEGAAGFRVERSADGDTFSEIAFVPARNAPGAYRYLDATAPLGTGYYRLRLLDLDGAEDLSGVAVAVREEGAPAMLPDGNVVAVGTPLSAAGAPGASALLLDLAGRVVSRGHRGGEGAGSFTLPTAGLTPGVYFLAVEAGGRASRVSSVVLQ